MTKTPYKKFHWYIGPSEWVKKSDPVLEDYWFIRFSSDGSVKPPNLFRRFVVWIFFGAKYVEVDE